MLYDLVLNFTLGGPHKTTLDFEILKIEFLMWFFMILFSNIWNLPLYRIMHMWKPKTSIIYETNNSKAKRIEVLNVVIQKRFFAENRVKIVIQWHINAYMGHLWPCSSQGHFFFFGGGVIQCTYDFFDSTIFKRLVLRLRFFFDQTFCECFLW